MRPIKSLLGLRTLVEWAGADRERIALWLPVAFGGGVITYFQFGSEPAVIWPLGIALAGVALAWIARGVPVLPLAAIALTLFAAGWGWSQAVTRLSAAPVLAEQTRAVDISGRIVDIEPREDSRTRAVLDRLVVAGLTPEQTPNRVRVTFPAAELAIDPGSILTARAILRPPPPPVGPGGYDFQRQAYFAGIGAVGFTLGSPEITPEPIDGWPLSLIIERLRRAIADDIAQSLSGPEAALASALVIGERGAIAAADRNAMRDAGLAHLLAISGLHIGIVAGFLFWGVRGLLALLPAVAVRFPIKKWAASAAMASALVYMLIAGTTPPTQRAFVMVAVGLLAIMIDRNPISMRLVGVAAIAVMLFAPEAVLGPSFQLSFAAVIALIAAFEWVEARKVLMTGQIVGPLAGGGRRNRPLLYLTAILYSTLVATLATAPFALFHFQQAALYGVAANLIAIPLMAFWIMPLLAVGCLASLVGIGDIGFVPAGWGLAVLRDVAAGIADWPGAVYRAPLAADWTIALVAIGGLWLCLWRGVIRWLGVVPVLVGSIAMLAARPADVIVSGFGAPFGVVPRGAALFLASTLDRDEFTVLTWTRMAGRNTTTDRRDLRGWAASANQDVLRCDAFGCLYTVQGMRIALSETVDSLDADCQRADLVIQLFPGGPDCPTGIATVTYRDLARDGAHTVRVSGSGEIGIASVGASRGERPWVVTNR